MQRSPPHAANVLRQEWGKLGEFGHSAIVKEFDEIVFKEGVGKVHGPVRPLCCYQVIYINEHTESVARGVPCRQAPGTVVDKRFTLFRSLYHRSSERFTKSLPVGGMGQKIAVVGLPLPCKVP